MKGARVLEFIKTCAKWLYRALINNLGWKILSVALALLLWSYIISADTSITQIKTLAGVEVTTTGITVLQSRDLALLTDTSLLSDIHVRVEASQASYSRVTNDTVHVELDLSQVTKAGVQQIELTGVTAYGKVVQITPASVEVVIEPLSSRYVPVNAELTGDLSDDYWYNISRVNPQQVTVSGPASIVREIVSARAQVNPTDMTSSYMRSVELALIDEDGAVIGYSLARPSITEATLNIDIYPKLQLSVSDAIDTAVTGTLPEGYQIRAVEAQPDVITVAAEPSLISELDALSFAPVDVSGRVSSFTTVAAVNKIKDLKYISSEQVTVTVYIDEIETSVTLQDVPITARGVLAGQSVSFSGETVSVRVTGPYTLVSALTSESVQAYVDVSGLGEGDHAIDVTPVYEGSGDVTMVCEPASVTVSVRETGN